VRRRGLAISLLLALAISATATTVVRRSLEELARDSALIVHGRAGQSLARWENGLLHTYTQIQVTRTLKGQTAGTVLVKQMGGQTEAYTQKVSGVRHFLQGQEVVLFLRPANTGEAYVVTGLMQGNFVVRQKNGQKIVSNGAPEVQTYESSTGQVQEHRGAELTLEQLESRIRRAVRQ
jgi:hypothetical protein